MVPYLCKFFDSVIGNDNLLKDGSLPTCNLSLKNLLLIGIADIIMLLLLNFAHAQRTAYNCCNSRINIGVYKLRKLFVVCSSCVFYIELTKLSASRKPLSFAWLHGYLLLCNLAAVWNILHILHSHDLIKCALSYFNVYP